MRKDKSAVRWSWPAGVLCLCGNVGMRLDMRSRRETQTQDLLKCLFPRVLQHLFEVHIHLEEMLDNALYVKDKARS